MSNLQVKNENVDGMQLPRRGYYFICTASVPGVSEVKQGRNFNESCSLGKRKEFWKSCKGVEEREMLLCCFLLGTATYRSRCAFATS